MADLEYLGDKPLGAPEGQGGSPTRGHARDCITEVGRPTLKVGGTIP